MSSTQQSALPPAADPYRQVRRALRGRWAIAILLGILGACLGGFAGWQIGRPLYRSQGLLRIATARPMVLQETDAEKPVQLLEAWLQTQQTLITSRRLVDAALADPAWQQTGRGSSTDVVRAFGEHLSVQIKPNSENLAIAFTDPDPQVATIAVGSVIRAFASVFSSHDRQADQQRWDLLAGRHDELVRRQQQLAREVAGTSAEFGSQNLDPFHEAAVQRVTRLETALMDIRLMLTLAGTRPATTLTARQIAMVDPALQRYLDARDAMEGQVEQLRLAGYAELHPQMTQARRSLQWATARLNEAAREYQTLAASTAGHGAVLQGATSPGMAAAASGHPAESLKADEAAIQKLHEQAKEQMAAIGAKRVKVRQLQAQTDGVDKELAEVDQRMAALQLAGGLGTRLSVVSSGETPIAPWQDRRLPMTVGGALAGAAVPIGLLVLAGLLGRRYRYSDEPEADLTTNTPLLGVLPTLTPGLGDLRRAADAAQCVHQIRVRLQSVPSSPHPVFLISSASPGEGKTSLSVALGLSFAAAGCRTLLVDADLIGRRLSRGFGAGRAEGLSEALARGRINGLAAATPHGGLYLLPAGQADATHAAILPLAATRRVLDEARSDFDVVLIDSGPLLGSVEASVLAPQADGVVLTIARRQQRPMVERAIQHLGVIGAKLAGAVFNRADPKDFYRSPQGSSIRSASGRYTAIPSPPPGAVLPASFGPLARSVAAFLPCEK